MRRRQFVKSVAAGAVVGSLAGCRPEELPGARRPNILFVMADQLRRDAVGAYGVAAVRTPHIDRAAADGLLFENGLSTCPVCAPYRGMLMTGLYPTHSGVLLNRINIHPGFSRNALASLFADAGYDTGYLGKWHLSAGIKGITDGLDDDSEAAERAAAENPDSEFTPPGLGRLGFEHWQAYNYHTDFRDYWYYEDEPRRIETGRYETEVLTDQAIAYMDRHRDPGSAPFLLVMAPHPPHPPFAPEYVPEGYLEKVAQAEFPPNVPREVATALSLQKRCYQAMVRQLDDSIGRLLDYLDESGLSRDTLFVITADHGEMLGSHGLSGKMYPYRESVGVPLIMRKPGTIAPGRTSAELYTPLDHLPTFCSLAGIPVPQTADGIDHSRLIEGGEGRGREAVLMMNYVSGYATFRSGGKRPEWRALQTRRETFVRWLDGRETLFDNAADPFQTVDAIGTVDRARLGWLREELDRQLAAADDAFLPGTEYASWYAPGRNLLRTARGPVG
jgi:uncharacterized sulfatase